MNFIEGGRDDEYVGIEHWRGFTPVASAGGAPVIAAGAMINAPEGADVAPKAELAPEIPEPPKAAAPKRGRPPKDPNAPPSPTKVKDAVDGLKGPDLIVEAQRLGLPWKSFKEKGIRDMVRAKRIELGELAAPPPPPPRVPLNGTIEADFDDPNEEGLAAAPDATRAGGIAHLTAALIGRGLDVDAAVTEAVRLFNKILAL